MDSIEILKGIRDTYQEYHHVTFTDEAIEASVRLSKEYIKERNLPDKAIDVMDEAGAMIHVYTDVPHHPAAGVLSHAATNAHGTHEKPVAVAKRELAKLQRKLKRLKDPKKIDAAKEAIANHVDTVTNHLNKKKSVPVVTKDHIIHVIAEWSGMDEKDIV